MLFFHISGQTVFLPCTELPIATKIIILTDGYPTEIDKCAGPDVTDSSRADEVSQLGGSASYLNTQTSPLLKWIDRCILSQYKTLNISTKGMQTQIRTYRLTQQNI